MRWYDNLIYRLFYKSVNRICERNPCVAHGLLLCFMKFCMNHPISEEAKVQVNEVYNRGCLMEELLKMMKSLLSSKKGT